MSVDNDSWNVEEFVYLSYEYQELLNHDLMI